MKNLEEVLPQNKEKEMLGRSLGVQDVSVWTNMNKPCTFH
jgi:hypothetical protein